MSGLGGGGPDDNDAQAGRLVVGALTSTVGQLDDQDVSRLVADTVRSHPRPGSNSDGNIVAFHPTGGDAKGLSVSENFAPGTGTGSNGTVAIGGQVIVRRLTPTECERLQGFPDGWTDLGGTSDSRRYSALGDAVTVDVAGWIGSRLTVAAARKAAGQV